jgi:hypothetical protein
MVGKRISRALKVTSIVVGVGCFSGGWAVSEAIPASAAPNRTAPVSVHADPFQEKTAAEMFKNVQVLKDVPGSKLQPAMSFITAALGVSCDYCHVNPFDSDQKPAKLMARRMMTMQFEINKMAFGGRDQVSCYTCHQGRVRPVSVPSLSRPHSEAPAAVAAKPAAALTTVDQVLDNYLQAIGGKAALDKVTSRVIKGTRLNVDGTTVTEEVYQKSPDKLLVVTTYPEVVYYSGFDGSNGWAASSDGRGNINERQRELIRRDAEFFPLINVKQTYTDLKLDGVERVGDRDMYVVEGKSGEGKQEKFYFDTATGLLFRRSWETRTVLGALPFQISFEDYKESDGVKFPTTRRWEQPGMGWSRKSTQISNNAEVNDSKFEKPPAK